MAEITKDHLRAIWKSSKLRYNTKTPESNSSLWTVRAILQKIARDTELTTGAIESIEFLDNGY